MTGMLTAALTYYPIYTAMMTASGFNPATPELGSPNPNGAMLTLLIWIQVIYVTMVYGPIAAFLVELFPTKIRYTSMSLPYHIGNGVFGGLVPLIGTWAVARTGDSHAGVFYPIFGWLLSPVFAGFAMALSSVFVVSNALRLRRYRAAEFKPA